MTYPLHGHQLSYDALLHENETLKQMNSRLQGEILERNRTIGSLEAEIERLKEAYEDNSEKAEARSRAEAETNKVEMEDAVYNQ